MTKRKQCEGNDETKVLREVPVDVKRQKHQQNWDDILQCNICQEPRLYHVQYSSCAHTLCVLCYNNWKRCSMVGSIQFSLQGQGLQVAVGNKPIVCPLCKKEPQSPEKAVGMASLLLYQVLEKSALSDSDSNSDSSSLKIATCPYCSEKLPDELYGATLHMFECKKQTVNCFKCETELPVGKESVYSHFLNDCASLIECVLCEGSGDQKKVPLCAYQDHLQLVHNGDIRRRRGSYGTMSSDSDPFSSGMNLPLLQTFFDDFFLRQMSRHHSH